MLDLNMTPDDWQARVLRANSDRVLMICSRQSGKTTVASLLALWEALYVPGSLCLCLAPVQRQSQELFARLLAAYRRLGRPVAAVRETRTELCLANTSRVVCLPGKQATVRCYANVQRIIVDECAQVADDNLFGSLMPMLAVSKGKMMCISTPWGRRGWFWQQFAGDDPTWTRFVVPATLCPRIDPAVIEEQRRLLGERWARQEFGAEFIEAEGQFFSTESIEAAFDTDVPAIRGF
jgi:hypothetical protein